MVRATSKVANTTVQHQLTTNWLKARHFGILIIELQRWAKKRKELVEGWKRHPVFDVKQILMKKTLYMLIPIHTHDNQPIRSTRQTQ